MQSFHAPVKSFSPEYFAGQSPESGHTVAENKVTGERLVNGRWAVGGSTRAEPVKKDGWTKAACGFEVVKKDG